MKRYRAAKRAGGTLMTPAQEAKAEVYKELGYCLVGMVGVNLSAARPMVKPKGHIVQVIGPDGDTTKCIDIDDRSSCTI
jgi:hypothetical protein